MPIKWGSPLLSKLGKRYWEKEQVMDIPLVFAIHDFHALGSMIWSMAALGDCVFGIRGDSEGKDQRVEFYNWGEKQNIALFGKPTEEKFELVMTGRHLTMRCDGNSTSHVALGGPIFHGHAASGFTEKVGHPGNVFWHQAKEANRVYQMLSGKQQQLALVTGKRPDEWKVPLQGPKGKFPGIPVTELSKDQRSALEKVLMLLVEPGPPRENLCRFQAPISRGRARRRREAPQLLRIRPA